MGRTAPIYVSNDEADECFRRAATGRVLSAGGTEHMSQDKLTTKFQTAIAASYPVKVICYFSKAMHR